ncbi:MAG: hypothetical protein R2764_04875 [Bacteroidales bacterium]
MKRTTLYPVIILIILIQVLGLASCQKPEFIYLSDEFKSFTVFPVGSYWVYEEINSGFVDTLKVDKVSLDFGHLHSESNVLAEKGSIKFSTAFSGTKIGLIGATEYSECLSYSSCYMYNSEPDTVYNPAGEYLNLGCEFFCCCDSGTKSRAFFFKYSGIIDTLSVGQRTFFDVRLFSNVIEDSLYLQQDTGLVKRYYFVKYVGLVKWEQYNGKVWEVRNFETK